MSRPGSKIWSKTRLSRHSKPRISSTDAAKFISQLPLTKFCTKKAFELEMVLPLTLSDSDVVFQIIETGKKYENFSDVHFITREDVLDLMKRLLDANSDIDLPKNVKECSRLLFQEKAQGENFLTLECLAMIVKLKIIEAMYQLYRAEVIKMQKRQKLSSELNELLKNCEPKETGKKKKGKKGRKGKKGKKGKKSKKSKSSTKSKKSSKSKKSDKSKKSKSSKKSKKTKKSKQSLQKSEPSVIVVDDYTEIILEDNDLVFDYNVDNHLVYFILSGFTDLLLLEELAKIQVNISGIIDVATEFISKEQDTISQLEELYKIPSKTEHLENTIWMKYRTTMNCPFKENLERFLYVVKLINYIKRQHLCYIKNLKLFNLEPPPEKLETKTFEKYNRVLSAYPLELINIPIIIDALIEEICWQESEQIHSLSDLTISTEESSKRKKEMSSYQVHEEDNLKKGMKAYNEIGRVYYDKSLQYFKQLQPLNKNIYPLKTYYQNRQISTEDYCYCDYSKDLFDYYHLAIFNQMKRTPFVPKQYEEFFLTENLVTHDYATEYQKVLTKNSTNATETNNDIIANYHMKEDINLSVLLQLIYDATQMYNYWDHYYCQESESVLLRFHNNVDTSGIDTKIWWERLRTPICLRDFCRFIVNEEKGWLEEHKLVEHAHLNDDVDIEICEGLKDLSVAELYEEYQYLLEPSCGIRTEEKKQHFKEVLDELLTYPKSENLGEFCKGEEVFAFDLGPKLCQLTGFTTIFHSDDGIKVTVDTSHFITERPKCTISIDDDDSSLVFHNNRPNAFHIRFKNETIISFAEFEEMPIIKKSEMKLTEPPNEEINEEIQEESEIEEIEEEKVENYNDRWVRIVRQSSTSVPLLHKNKSILDNSLQLDDANFFTLLELFKEALFKNRAIYKITTKRSIKRLRRISSLQSIPLGQILKRVLFKPAPKKRKIKGYSVLNILTTRPKTTLKYDFKITLPNGLYISTLPRNKKVAEIKQQYRFCRYKEQYRIFYANGVILIKNSDGSVTIYRSNGEIIHLTDQSENYSVTCAKKIADEFEDLEDEICPYKLSRFKDPSKIEIVNKESSLYEFGEIPYTRKSVLHFEGQRIDISDEKTTAKQVYYVLNEHDYHAEEVFYEREDGMTCIVNKKGNRIFQFPDGTKITSHVEIEKELIFVSKNPKSEGWVSVIISYEFEHPDYITVTYNQKEGSTGIFLQNSVIKICDDSFVMSSDKDTALEVTSEGIIFLKSCKMCESDCICKIHLQQEPKLLEVYDSYDKYFSCDRLGYCSINHNFIKKSKNRNDCKHKWRNDNQKLFILNKTGPPGTLLWKDSTIENKFLSCTNDKAVKVVNYMNRIIKKQTVEFFTEIYQDFPGRFTMSQKHNRNICLSKYKPLKTEKFKVFYVVYRILIEFQNLTKEPEIIEELKEFLHSRVGDFDVLLKGIQEIISYVTDRSGYRQDLLSYQMSMKEDDIVSDKPSKSDSFSIEKLTAQDVVTKWRNLCNYYKNLIRNRQFPPYFHSEYYQYILSKT